MTNEEIYKNLNFNSKYEARVYMPNEIFDNLIILKGQTSKHIAFAYTYYYFITWLYRYAKYEKFVINKQQLLSFLGYNGNTGRLDYIIKKNGVLDNLGLTITTTNYPVYASYETDVSELNFTLLEDNDIESQKHYKKRHSSKYTIKYPVLAFERPQLLKSDKEESNLEAEYEIVEGTFYDISNTHLVDFRVFLFCMSKKDLGCTAFYIWSYLQMKKQIFNKYDAVLQRIADETYLSEKTVERYHNAMRGYNMIEVIHNQKYFSLALENRKANSHITNTFEYFKKEKVEYKKMEVVSVEKHLKLEENKKHNKKRQKELDDFIKTS